MIEDGTKIRAVQNEDINALSHLEAGILINEVKTHKLPTCDLDLPTGANRILRVMETGLENHVASVRKSKLETELADPNRRIFVAESSNGQVLGKGCLRIKPEQKEVVFYSFNILPEAQGSTVGLELLRAGFEAIAIYESETNSTIDTVVVGRYQRSEDRNPFFTKLTRLVNAAISPDSDKQDKTEVKTEESTWKGHKVTYYIFPKNLALDLFEEIGEKYTKFFS